MGHRALHAVPTADGRYDCYRTRWGGLAVFETPVDLPDPRERNASLVARSVDATGVLSVLEPADEALFVHGEGVAYLVCRLDVPTVTDVPVESEATTALVPVTDGAAARRLDCELRVAKTVLGDTVDAGLVSRDGAENYLRTFLARRPRAREAVWLPPARDGSGRPS